MLGVAGEPFATRLAFTISTSRFGLLRAELPGQALYPVACNPSAGERVCEVMLKCSSPDWLTPTKRSHTPYRYDTTVRLARPAACGG
jgi:hypothetical protein